MKNILCYGDSNTWGYNPATKERYESDVRWTGVLSQQLGDKYKVIEEGFNGRTTVWDDPIEGYKNGKEYLIPCLGTHRPLDLVIIMLGTNDLKHRFSLTAFDIAQGAGVLVDIVQRSASGRDGKAPEVLLLAPPPVGKLTYFKDMFRGSEEKSREFSRHFGDIVQKLGCRLLDTSRVIVSSDIDGIHFEAEEHQKLGEAEAEKVCEILAD